MEVSNINSRIITSTVRVSINFGFRKSFTVFLLKIKETYPEIIFNWSRNDNFWSTIFSIQIEGIESLVDDVEQQIVCKFI